MAAEGPGGPGSLACLNDTSTVSVATPAELEAAVFDRACHIVITAHLDLTTLPLRETAICPDGCASPLPDVWDTASIRGACARPPTDEEMAVLKQTPGAVTLLPFREGQCLVTAFEDLFLVNSVRMWLDNVYMRMAFSDSSPVPREKVFLALASFPPLSKGGRALERGTGEYYVTRSTFQGDGIGSAGGVWADESAYVENCTFANLGGDKAHVCEQCAGAVSSNDATVTVVNSTFFDPAPLPDSLYVRAWGGGGVALYGCQFGPANKPPEETPFYAGEGATLYSDSDDVLVPTDTAGVQRRASPVEEVPQLPVTSAQRFLRRDDPWFVDIRNLLGETLPPQPAYPAPSAPVPLLDNALAAPPRVAPGVADDGGGNGSLRVIVIAAIAAVAVLLAAVLAVCCVLRRRRARRKGVAVPQVPAGSAGPGMHMNKQMVRGAASGEMDVTSMSSGSDAQSVWARNGQLFRRARSPSVSSEKGSATGAPTAGRAGAAPTLLDLVAAQLDTISPRDIIFEQFKLLGRSHRCLGSKSVIAMAVGAHADIPFAAKFFADRAAFNAELAARQTPALAIFVPQIVFAHDPAATNANGVGNKDPLGRLLPPCIVSPRGESLAEWSRRAAADKFQAVMLLSHVAVRLRDIHAAGFAHRGIKPAHIMHFRSENRWTVIDFDRAAAIGTQAPLAFDLEYAAPELVAAAASGAAEVEATAAADCWALGVVGFELLSGGRLLEANAGGKGKLEAQLLGSAPLPWEVTAEPEATLGLSKIGVFREPLLALLRRDPAQRSSMQDFCNACDSLVASHTTTAGAGGYGS